MHGTIYNTSVHMIACRHSIGQFVRQLTANCKARSSNVGSRGPSRGEEGKGGGRPGASALYLLDVLRSSQPAFSEHCCDGGGEGGGGGIWV